MFHSGVYWKRFSGRQSRLALVTTAAAVSGFTDSLSLLMSTGLVRAGHA